MNEQERIEHERHERVVAIERKITAGTATQAERDELDRLYDEGGY